jgi:hypothetical protein
MTIETFLNRLNSNPESVSFQETIAVIEENFTFIPMAFSNGHLTNTAGENNGSCKIFAFAKLNQLNKLQTLTCFGSYYFEDVLQHPEATDHQNIRNFLEFGWDGIWFESQVLAARK